MLAAIPFPSVSPEIFSIDIGSFTFALRWYAMAYIVGIIIGWRMAVAFVRRPQLWRGEPPMTAAQVDDFVTWVIVGVILGGRLGFVLFYAPGYYLTHPLEILQIWNGGMSFHGGFLGVMTVILVYSRRIGAATGSVADMLVAATPPGLLLGRIANFINAELWGLPTTMPWGVVFPGGAAQDCPLVDGPCARHPSQLYEAGLEGLLLGLLILFLVFARKWFRTPWAITGVFIGGYGGARFFVEFFRQADAQYITLDNPLGHVVRLGDAGLSMGQLLSLPMLLIGIALVVWARRRAPAAS
ncbi:prolipoprotein diacylglyceryl transferase [Psychromarinibacter halotolerans]|uniref:Phosphatidylglycerol--prolipoprotein diacylglyceryl transferase n=1 Tax=Psychromarinibacter halotolerans TaxID=1775175 RepID=A0ABV7GL42_9RHOB|nr:prolipoprotein diacylglyceryl transferase [Psychromarinibacter halotolerans]MDF0597830.1 prolipoprotein diacylglyceryl transferase [Psychromarinibacter halotolerans]